MKALLFAGLAVGALSIGAVAPAQALGGCGLYSHRGFNGLCYPNGGAYVRPVVPVYGYGYGYGYGWRRPWGGPGWGRPGYGYYRRW